MSGRTTQQSVSVDVYPAQQDSFETSFSKVCAANFSPSTDVSYGKFIAPKSSYVIGEMSKRTGVNIETIRYYEDINIMLQPDRTVGGNRQYNHDQLKRLSFIKASRELGFSIDEIRALLEIVDRQDFTCGDPWARCAHLDRSHLL